MLRLGRQEPVLSGAGREAAMIMTRLGSVPQDEIRTIGRLNVLHVGQSYPSSNSDTNVRLAKRVGTKFEKANLKMGQ